MSVEVATCGAEDVLSVLNIYPRSERKGIVPSLPHTQRVWRTLFNEDETTCTKSYGASIGEMTDKQRGLLCDPQTSGGLLCVAKRDGVDNFLALTRAAGLELASIGQIRARGDKSIEVV